MNPQFFRELFFETGAPELYILSKHAETDEEVEF